MNDVDSESGEKSGEKFSFINCCYVVECWGAPRSCNFFP